MSLDHTTLPSGLQHLTFGWYFNQCLDNVTLPTGLQTLTFGAFFDQSLDKVALPSGLQCLTLGKRFNQRLDNLPNGLTVHLWRCTCILCSATTGDVKGKGKAPVESKQLGPQADTESILENCVQERFWAETLSRQE